MQLIAVPWLIESGLCLYDTIMLPILIVDRENQMKQIIGEKVVLREQREEDAEFFSYWFNQPDIMFRCGFTEPTDVETELRYINEYHRTDDSVGSL